MPRLRQVLLTAILAIVTIAVSTAQPSQAQVRDNTGLTRLDTDSPEAYAFFNAIGIYDLLVIVAEESVAGADQIRVEFFPDLAPEIWESEMRTLFDIDALVTGFEAAWQDEAVDAEARAVILDFFDTDLGQDIVAAEIAARAGMADPGIAEAARAAVMMAERENDPRLERFAAFSADLGLVDRNVTAMMNAQIQFLTGLADAGGMEPALPQDELLSFIAAQADDLRAEAEEWLAAYQLMAYGALSPEVFDAFAELNATPEGQALAAAVFAAFDTVFDRTQYDLGRLAARYAAGDDI